MDSNPLSISVRLRRRQTETAQVSVPITEEVLQADGGGRKMDVDKIIEVALQMGKLDSTAWEIEGEPEIQLHPEQKSPGTTSIQ